MDINDSKKGKGRIMKRESEAQWLMYWNANDTSGCPVSARSKSSWLFLSSALVKWFQLRTRVQQSIIGKNEENNVRAGITV